MAPSAVDWAALRAANLAAAPEESATRGLVSDTKKATTFVRKLRGLTDENRQALADELSKLNLRRYVSEVAAALAEAKLRAVDVPAAAYIASMMHQLYADFAAELLPLVVKAAVAVAPAGEAEAERAARLSRKRTSLRLLGELFVVGVHGEFAPVLAALKEVAKQDAESTKLAADAQPSSGGAEPPPPLPNLGGVTSFAKACVPALLAPHLDALCAAAADEITAPPPPRAAAATPSPPPASAEGALLAEREAKSLHALLGNYLRLVVRAALAEHKLMRRQERANRCAARGQLRRASRAG
jgi:hypothetical protein